VDGAFVFVGPGGVSEDALDAEAYFCFGLLLTNYI
jgi:hypothetical protein